MNPENTMKADEAPDIPEDLPFISLIIPFETKMNTKRGFDRIVNTAVDKAEKELMKSYPEDKAILVLKKLQLVIKGLDHKPFNKSIAIFVSPLVKKVYYFTYSAEEMNNYKEPFIIPDTPVINHQLSIVF